MADFSQSALITTLHDLGVMKTQHFVQESEEAMHQHNIGLVLPVTASDVRAEPFAQIIAQLSEVRYVDTIIVALGQAPNKGDYDATRDRIRPLGDRAEVLWTDGPRMRRLYERLNNAGYNLSIPGKGRSVWTAIGWLLADPELRVFAVHDCDIMNYDAAFPARLCLPIVRSGLGFQFVKAYYARCADRLYGRLVRLLTMPLLQAMPSVFGRHEFLLYLQGFHYPLAGEVALTSGLARSLRIASHWGLEVAMLDEVYRNTPIRRICQVDLGLPFDHKHQELSLGDPGSGLMGVARDVLFTILHAMTDRGRLLNPDHLEKLHHEYLRIAKTMIEKYRADAVFNGLDFVGGAEEAAVKGFADQILAAVDVLHEDTSRTVMISSWESVLQTFPELNHHLRDVTAADAETKMGSELATF